MVLHSLVGFLIATQSGHSQIPANFPLTSAKAKSARLFEATEPDESVRRRSGSFSRAWVSSNGNVNLEFDWGACGFTPQGDLRVYVRSLNSPTPGTASQVEITGDSLIARAKRIFPLTGAPGQLVDLKSSQQTNALGKLEFKLTGEIAIRGVPIGMGPNFAATFEPSSGRLMSMSLPGTLSVPQIDRNSISSDRAEAAMLSAVFAKTKLLTAELSRQPDLRWVVLGDRPGALIDGRTAAHRAAAANSVATLVYCAELFDAETWSAELGTYTRAIPVLVDAQSGSVVHAHEATLGKPSVAPRVRSLNLRADSAMLAVGSKPIPVRGASIAPCKTPKMLNQSKRVAIRFGKVWYSLWYDAPRNVLWQGRQEAIVCGSPNSALTRALKR